VVERGPEKAGVGGSIPSLATTFFSKERIGSGPVSRDPHSFIHAYAAGAAGRFAGAQPENHQ
jgi:hypothetical protein